tara:strand:+ start:152 stop:385 length:234 start_codon:yes stop_codon:yes gene_type:complete
MARNTSLKGIIESKRSRKSPLRFGWGGFGGLQGWQDWANTMKSWRNRGIAGRRQRTAGQTSGISSTTTGGGNYAGMG